MLGFLFFALAVTVLVHATPTSSSQWPYLQIYPPVNESDDRTPLYYAAVFSFGGDYTSIGVLPGVQIALDYINSEPSILPGYTLHYTLMDSQCNRSIALDAYFYQLNSPPTKVGWLGSGCSPATIPTAELTQYYNITQVSCISSSPDLRNRPRFRYYFQLLETEVLIAQGFYGIIKYFGWKKVRIIIQDESLFTASMDALTEALTDSDVDVTELRFRTVDGIDGINTEFLDAETRIYVLAMFSQYARDILCEAYRRGFRYPKYMIITYGWYNENWWTGPATSSQYNCTAEDRATILPYTMGPVLPEFATDLDAEAEPGITASDFMSDYFDHLKRDINKGIKLENFIDDFFIYAYACHEGTLAFAYALNKTIADLNEDSTFNREAAELSDLPVGETFTMANFTYANSAVVSRMFAHLQNTSFSGISGSEVRFNDQGTRDLDSVLIRQYQINTSDGQLFREVIAIVTEDRFEFVPNSNFTFPMGTPHDGVPIQEVVTVSLSLTVLYVFLATAGIVFAVVCLIFTIMFRNKRLIRLSSPNLNYLIVLGAVILYLNVISFVVPTTDRDFVAVLCNVNPWLTSLGYSFCYGTIIIKMLRVWSIFNKPLGIKSSFFQDYVMVLFVLGLVVIDFVILITYLGVEGLRENLGVERVANREFRGETLGPTAEVREYSVYVCISDGKVVLYAILYGYKGFLQVFALLLAFSTRKVKVKGLDDSKYIAAAIYVTSIVLAVIIVSTYTLMDYVNVFPSVVGMGFLLGTTMILGLVFVPRMVGLYKDPEGKDISFKTTTQNENSYSDDKNKSDIEVKELRRRVNELENSLIQYSSAIPNVNTVPPDDVNDAVVEDSKRNGTHNSPQINGTSSDNTVV